MKKKQKAYELERKNKATFISKCHHIYKENSKESVKQNILGSMINQHTHKNNSVSMYLQWTSRNWNKTCNTIYNSSKNEILKYKDNKTCIRSVGENYKIKCWRKKSKT